MIILIISWETETWNIHIYNVTVVAVYTNYKLCSTYNEEDEQDLLFYLSTRNNGQNEWFLKLYIKRPIFF